MKHDLTQGNITKAMLRFSLPMLLGNMLQQLYNVVDTLVVGRFLGAHALAAVGSSFALMAFLTAINLGFCMGSGAVFAQFYGAKREDDLKVSIVNAFVFIGAMTIIISILAQLLLNRLLLMLNVQPEAIDGARAYLRIVLFGMPFTFIYNFFAAILRSIGNSLTPLMFLCISALLNISLDLLFVIGFGWGIEGAAAATVIAQGLSALFVLVYFLFRAKSIRPSRHHLRYDSVLLSRVISNSTFTSLQQSVMNLGVLMVQGLINSFGVTAMAGFAAAVKIDSFAYMPVSDFGQAFSVFVAQNYGANNMQRLRDGVKRAVAISATASVTISALVVVFAEKLMLLFVKASETEVIAVGVSYLRIEGCFYCLLGFLMLLYGFHRGLGRPGMSAVLTTISLGTRVLLAYMIAPSVGLVGIWWSIPIGWFLADSFGFIYTYLHRKQLFSLRFS